MGSIRTPRSNGLFRISDVATLRGSIKEDGDFNPHDSHRIRFVQGEYIGWGPPAHRAAARAHTPEGSGARRVEWLMTLLEEPSQYGPVENPPSVGGRCRSPDGVAS